MGTSSIVVKQSIGPEANPIRSYDTNEARSEGGRPGHIRTGCIWAVAVQPHSQRSAMLLTAFIIHYPGAYMVLPWSNLESTEDNNKSVQLSTGVFTYRGSTFNGQPSYDRALK